MTEPLSALITALILLAAAAVIFYPRYGVVSRWRRARQQTERVRIEDALTHLLGCEMSGERFTANSLAGALQITADQAANLLLDMERRGLLHV